MLALAVAGALPRAGGGGLGDRRPPHYRKQEGEPRRVQPSRASPGDGSGVGSPAEHKPLIEIGRARKKEDALAGLERWKARHPEAASHLVPATRSSTTARPLHDVDARSAASSTCLRSCARGKEPPDPSDEPASPWGVSSSGGRRRDRRQLARLSDLARHHVARTSTGSRSALTIVHGL